MSIRTGRASIEEAMMHTLFDFLTYTKGLGYIVAGLLLVGFIPFWKFLTEREREE
jgi:hypothetical protein